MAQRETPVFVGSPDVQVTNWAALGQTKTQITPTNANYAQVVTELLYFCADTSVATTVRIYHNDGTNSRQIAQISVQVPASGQTFNLLQSSVLASIDDKNPLLHLGPGDYLEVDYGNSTAGIKNVRATYATYDPT